MNPNPLHQQNTLKEQQKILEEDTPKCSRNNMTFSDIITKVRKILMNWKEEYYNNFYKSTTPCFSQLASELFFINGPILLEKYIRYILGYDNFHSGFCPFTQHVLKQLSIPDHIIEEKCDECTTDLNKLEAARKCLCNLNTCGECMSFHETYNRILHTAMQGFSI